MPSRIGSRAVVKKLQSVAASLHASDHKRIMVEINEMLEERRELAPLCLKVLKANLLHHFASESMGKGAPIPESSNKLAVISKTLKRKLIVSLLTQISPQTLKKCERSDPDKFVEKLFYFLLAEVPSSPNVHEFETPFLAEMTVRAHAVGNRAAWLVILNDTISWYASGIYALDCKEDRDDEQGEADTDEANYVMHKPTKTKAAA